MDYFQFIKKILDHTSESMIIIDNQSVVQYVNPPFLKMIGLTQNQVIGNSLEDFCSNECDKSFFMKISDDLQKLDLWQGTIEFATPVNQTKKHASIILNLELEKEEPPLHLVLFPFQSKVESENFDDLTGLPRVEIFLDRVDQAIIANRRDKSNIAMFLINLDRFALIKDGLGRGYGDKVLKKISSRLKDSFRQSDTISRIAGHTFGLLIKVTQETHSAIVAEKVMQILSKPITIDNQKIVLTASIGIATCSDENEQKADNIMGFAESAMHHVKEKGGKMYHFFTIDLNKTARKRIEIENDLRNAIEKEEFSLFYQPKVDIITNKIWGVEALIRWNHPKHGMVLPFKFIPVAEETGLIIDIGRWVLNKACRQNSKWQKQKLKPLSVAVNVSPRQFQYPGFYEDVKNAIEQSGLNPGLLELEITESLLMSDVEESVNKLKKLIGVGLSMAIDDFGTGYSNLKYLLNFPISTLKIDRTFIKNVETDGSIAALTHSIIRMAKSLDLKIVAEGVENINQVSFLRDHGCNIVQGDYYSKPLPAEEFGELLKKGKILK
jgi:diguanylate cyclase (GGDEF)-like protein